MISKTSISRETFTRSTNKALNLVGQSLTPAIKLTSKSLIKWDVDMGLVKVSRRILIFLFGSYILWAFSYLLSRKNGDVFKSTLFTLYFLAVKMGLIEPNVPLKLNHYQPNQQIAGKIVSNPYGSILDQSRPSNLLMDPIKDFIEHSSLVPQSSYSQNVVNELRAGDLSQPGKFGPGSKAKGAAARNFQRRGKGAGNKPTRSQSSGSSFAEAFPVRPDFPARPGGNGLFGPFTPAPTPDPQNPGCAGGPRSITVLSQSKSGQQESVREITAHDGVKGRLTDKSTNHLMSKHGHEVGINDPLPPNPSQKPTEYKNIRTRINKENKEKFGDIVEEILKDPNTKPYPDVSMRGIKGHGYYTENYGKFGFFVGIHTEGKFQGQIMKAQSVNEQQLEVLKEFKSID